MFKNIRRVTHFKKYTAVRYAETIAEQQSGKRKNLSEISQQNIIQEKPLGWDTAKPFDCVPGPQPIPIFGNLWHFFPFVGKYHGIPQHELNLKQYKEYGDIVRLKDLKIRKDILICFDPKDIETVFRNDGQWPMRGILPSIKYYRLKIRRDVFQDFGGVFTSDGEDWQKARSLLNPIMMQPRIVKQYSNSMEKVANDFVELMKRMAKDDPNSEMPATFLNDLSKWALESIGLVALDSRLGMLTPNLAPGSEEQQFVDDVLNFFIYLYKIDVVPNMSKYISTPTWRNYIKLLDRLTSFVQKQLDKAMLKIEQNSGRETERPLYEMSVIERLLKIDKKYALGTAMDMLIGGVDTTSKTLAAALYYLACNTECQHKLRKELIEELPSLDTPVTSSKLENMRYLKAVLKEALRIAPISVGTVRKTNRNLVLSGYQVPKETEVLLPILALTWNEKYFKDAKKFIPERWLRENLKQSNLNPWVYLPFGFGPRTCLGRRLAQLELELLTAKIIRNFELEWHHDEMKFSMIMLYGVDSPLRIRVKPVTT